MTDDFTGRVVLVTGGSRGIGRAIALRFAHAGADVAFVYRRDEQAADHVAQEIRAAGRRALAVRAELGSSDQVAAAVRRVGEELGRLDVLIANAASTAFKPLLEVKPHHLERTFAISVTGFVVAVQEAVSVMNRDGSGGHVVAISGCDSFRSIPGHGALGAAKAAMECLVRYLAHELGPRGISVNCVNPGYVDTDSARFYLGTPASARRFEATLTGMSPLRFWGSPVDVAGVVTFLCSPAADWIRGQTLYVDGGVFQTSPGHTPSWWARRDDPSE
jgi:enoyl-[acyl-carrier protein] reductase III